MFSKKIHIQSTTELVATPLITNGVNGAVNGASILFYVVYSVALPARVKAGSIVSITTVFEGTNPQNYNLEFGRFVKLATGADDNTEDNLLLQADADNATPGNHHWVMPVSRQLVVQGGDWVNKFINVIVYCVSSSAIDGQNAIIEAGYGHLDVVIDPNGNI